MLIIDASYFFRAPLLIEGLSDSASMVAESMIEDVNFYINIYEKKYLFKMLGREKALQFIEVLREGIDDISKGENLDLSTDISKGENRFTTEKVFLTGTKVKVKIVFPSLYTGSVYIRGTNHGSDPYFNVTYSNGIESIESEFIVKYNETIDYGFINSSIQGNINVNLSIVYDDSADNIKWKPLYDALVSFDGMEGVSPVANFVYFHYVRQNQQRATGLGVVKTDSDNPVVNCTHMLCRVWNDMVEMNAEIKQLLLESYNIEETDPEMLTEINPLCL